jgi:hypothetical protein
MLDSFTNELYSILVCFDVGPIQDLLDSIQTTHAITDRRHVQSLTTLDNMPSQKEDGGCWAAGAPRWISSFFRPRQDYGIDSIHTGTYVRGFS